MTLRDESSSVGPMRVEQLADTPPHELVLVVFGALRYLEDIELEALVCATDSELRRRGIRPPFVLQQRIHRSIVRRLLRWTIG